MLDPQRLNLYVYARNNPLKFTDPTGMDVVLGQCGSGMTASMCQAAPTSGLSKQDRTHVRRVKGDGTNGFKKGQWGLPVDANYRSSSKNFSNLQTAANDHTGTAALNVVVPRTPIATLMGAQQGGQTTVQPFKDAMTAIRPITSGASSTDYSQRDAEHQSNMTDSGKGGVARISTLNPPPKERDSKTGLDYFGRLYSVRKPT